MSTFGSLVLARSELPLVHLPQVSSAFGSMWRHLEDRGGGWQLLDMAPPMPHHWPTVGAGPADLAAVTGTPLLAAFVSDTSCVQLVGAESMPCGHDESEHETECRSTRPAADIKAAYFTTRIGHPAKML
ncbi:hypothetical protein [Micromonospora chersina]|uniref:hypothetical protein n=1 Tax=Micromonospora chersina TaxID=47854 RepID=UPI003723CB12